MRLLKHTITMAMFLATLLLITSKTVLAEQPLPAEGDEAALIAVLKSEDAGIFEKAKACQRLAIIGTSQCVDVLADLLDDDELAHYARTGLEANPDPSVDVALRAALGKLKGQELAGVIGSIGMRRDADATDTLATLLGSEDTGVAAAAAFALGRIGETGTLLKALDGSESLRPAVADALLTAAADLESQGKGLDAAIIYTAIDKAQVAPHITIAARGGLIRAQGVEKSKEMLISCLRNEDDDKFAIALRMAQELKGEAVTTVLLEALVRPGSSAARKAILIHVLGDRDDEAAKAGMGLVLKAAKNEVPEVRVAAIEALGKMGDATVVWPLLVMAGEDNEAIAAAAIESLSQLEGQGVDAAIVEALGETKDIKTAVVIEVIGRRGISSAVPSLLKRIDSDDENIKAAAIGALGVTAGPDHLPLLVDRLIAAEPGDTHDTIKAALTKAVLRMPDRDACASTLASRLTTASSAAKIDLIDLLGVVGGEKALESVAGAAGGDDEAIQDAATRVLGGWMTPDVAPVLLQLAKTGPTAHRVRCLRGYARIPRQFDVPTEQRIAMCGEILAAATRDAERELAIEIAGRYPTASGLALVTPLLDSPSLKMPATAAVIAIAEKIVDESPAAVVPALEKVVAAADPGEVQNRAKALLAKAKKNM